MEFRFTPEQEAFRGEVRTFLKQELPEGYVSIPGAPDEGDYEFGQAFLKRLAPKKWIAPAWPQEYGGWGPGGCPCWGAVLDLPLGAGAARRWLGHGPHGLVAPAPRTGREAPPEQVVRLAGPYPRRSPPRPAPVAGSTARRNAC